MKQKGRQKSTRNCYWRAGLDTCPAPLYKYSLLVATFHYSWNKFWGAQLCIWFLFYFFLYWMNTQSVHIVCTATAWVPAPQSVQSLWPLLQSMMDSSLAEHPQHLPCSMNLREPVIIAPMEDKNDAHSTTEETWGPKKFSSPFMYKISESWHKSQLSCLPLTSLYL